MRDFEKREKGRDCSERAPYGAVRQLDSGIGTSRAASRPSLSITHIAA
jgi:hypothetical protein